MKKRTAAALFSLNAICLSVSLALPAQATTTPPPHKSHKTEKAAKAPQSAPPADAAPVADNGPPPVFGIPNDATTAPLPTLDAKAWLLLDQTSGAVIASRNADDRVEPASLTKIMTAYLIFRGLRDHTLKLDQMATVSVRAWKVAPGSSKMFIEPGKQVSIDDLLSGLLIQSGNDAAVALAEAASGSEEAFVQKMNEEAQAMGLAHTHFNSPHGLPDPQTYSTASDLAKLAGRLIQDFPDLYVRYDSQKSFRYNNITQPNRNRMLWIDPSVDGGKTGHTDAAGYCMIVSAVRPGASGPRRLISVVMGTPSEKVRTAETGQLLNWGFGNFETVKLYAKGQVLATPQVWKGKQDDVKIGFERDVYVTVPRAWASRLKPTLAPRDHALVAPLQKDDTVGRVNVMLDDKAVMNFPVRALEPVEEAGFFGRGWDGVKLWVHEMMGGDKPAA
ncbi:D-alanyl-D-alanine carboxypeptidase family protein [Achromobacter aloeverae]|uniref:serine-type D-Ala-D-Ala carboxypeptidase n=1 Tax=Achromobacter aloeverae TaxID=1750518 RepID=A0A4Q1HPI0_9BURK|nr:D-alanyl-D-alanine carboxypeptidase family protein [Achromobacter aloeverae]RXN92952.1 peptidase [Achromobacter aloeverae]